MQLFTHKDETSPLCARLWEAWHAPVKLHAFDEQKARLKIRSDIPIETFDTDHKFAGLEALWLPGHSAGFTGYPWKGKRGTYLFSGDIIVPRARGYRGSGALDWYRKSLNRLQKMKIDFMMPNKGAVEMPPPIDFGKAARAAMCADVLAGLERSQKNRERRQRRAKA